MIKTMYFKSSISSGISILFLVFASAHGDLYNSSDPLVLLNVTNFHDIVLDAPNAWIIEFYLSWCGHCIKYAPTWRAFSHEVVDWDHTIKAAVLDCSDEYNVDLCRDYDLKVYPTIRLFGAFANQNDLGQPTSSREILDLQASMIDFLIEQETANNKSDSWVNLLLYDEPVKDIFNYAKKGTSHAVVIVEDENSITGSQVILDLGNYRMVYVRRMNWESLHLDPFELPSLPALIIINRDGSTEIPTEDLTLREEITAYIISHLNLKRRMLDGNAPGSIPRPPKEEGRDPSNKMDKETNFESTDEVFMVDIENTLSYAFNQEVSSKKLIEGESLDALKAFTRVLVDYLPTRRPVHQFLSNLKQYLDGVSTLTGSDFEQTIQDLQSNNSLLPQQRSWKRCKGSDEKYRGYPCGLWTVFHLLSVGGFQSSKTDESYDPQEVLKAIHGYVKHFFGCGHCSRHFQEMYAIDAETFVQKPNDEIEWLWLAHNKVNKRLKGDLSEDPQHPKQQFPTKEKCPQCWNEDNSFNVKEVLAYLKKIYGKSSISSVGGGNLTPYDSNEIHLKAQFNVGTLVSLSLLTLSMSSVLCLFV